MLDGGPAHSRLTVRPSALTAAEVAWIALLPCALVGLAAIVFLGPPIGHALFAPGSDVLWPPEWWVTTARPEPEKQGRFIVAVLAPLLLVLAIVAGARRRIALAPRTTAALSLMGHALVLTIVAIALREQHPAYTASDEVFPALVPTIFDRGRVVVAALIVLITLAVHRRSDVAARFASLVRETRARRLAAAAIAAAFAAIWVLKAVTTDDLGLGVVSLNLPWTLNDSVAVLDGRTPLVDYHPIYAKLLPYVTAGVLSVLGTTALAYTAFMALLSGLALMACYAVFRRVTRSSLLALGLFVPFVATSDITLPIEIGSDAGLDTSPMMLAALWPMRYGGAYLLAWLVARHLDGGRPRHAVALFLLGGLLAIDSLDFGMGAVGATAAALLCARAPAPREVLRLVGSAAAGGLGAVVVVAAITLARTGQLPDFGLLLEWPRIFTRLGWFAMPLPTWDLHVAIYATFVAAVAAAVVRLVRRADDVLLTGMLAWSGTFGLLIGGYFVGRPDAIKLTGILSAWSFALSMLTIVCVRSLTARAWRPAIPHLLVLLGFALSLCSVSMISPPNEQIARLTDSTAESTYLWTAKQFIAERTQPGETVVVLAPMSYAITRDLGLRNVAPYGFMNAIVAQSQMARLLDTLREKHVRAVFIPAPNSGLLNEGDSAPQHLQVLQAIGFTRQTTQAGIVELTSS